MKKKILLLGTLFTSFYTIKIQAQEKRKVDLEVELLSPVADSVYKVKVEDQIPFKARVTNRGPDALKSGDTLIYWSGATNVALDVLMEDVPVGGAYMIYDTYFTTTGAPEGSEQLELCVTALWNNEMAGPSGDTTSFATSWIDEVEENNVACAIFTLSSAATSLGDTHTADEEFFLYPVPVSTELNIQASNLPTGQYEVHIYSIDGRKVICTTVIKQGQGTSSSIDVHNLAAGSYYLQMEHNGRNYTAKFIIQ